MTERPHIDKELIRDTLPSRELCIEMINDPEYKLSQDRKDHILKTN